MNEENGTRGAKKYAEMSKMNNENHIGGIESDAGGHTPRGFSIDANEANTTLVQSWKKLLAPYGLHDLDKGGRIFFPSDRKWAKDLIDICSAFPAGGNDDIVDTCTQAWLRLRKGWFVTHSDDEEYDEYPEQRRMTMYG